jgi:hypothetical protein
MALVTAIAAALGCGSSSTKRTSDGGGQSDTGGVADAAQVTGVTADTGRADQVVRDVASDTDAADAARGDVPIAPDVVADQSVDHTAADASAIIDGEKVVDVSKADAPPVGFDGVSVDGAAIDVADASGNKPARITFMFRNVGSEILYLQVECELKFQVVSDATSTSYPNSSICLCNCVDPTCTSLPSCAPCAPRSGTAVVPGAVREYTWTAQTNLLLDKVGTTGVFKCLSHDPLAPGAYHVSTSVFRSESDAAANRNATTATAAFQLGTSDIKVDVPIR